MCVTALNSDVSPTIRLWLPELSACQLEVRADGYRGGLDAATAESPMDVLRACLPIVGRM